MSNSGLINSLELNFNNSWSSLYNNKLNMLYLNWCGKYK